MEYGSLPIFTFTFSGRPPINSISSGRPSAPQPVNFTGNPDLHPCLSCGGRNRRQNCKFRQAECHKCQKKGHLATVCRSKNVRSSPVGNARNTASGNLHTRTRDQLSMASSDHSRFRDVFTKTPAGISRNESDQFILKCVFESYILYHDDEGLDEAAALINEAAGEEELDPTVLPYELEEIVGNIKMEGDKLSDNMKRQNINLWIAAMGTGIEPTL